MSIARVHSVTKCRKSPGKCGGCDKPIRKGQRYAWWTVGFRSRAKHLRCGDCKIPPPSARESNSSFAMILAAQEGLESALGTAKTLADVKAAVEAAAADVREAIDDWEDKKSNLEEAFPGGSPTIEQIDEYLEHAEALADGLEEVELEETDDEAEDKDDPAAPDIEKWREDAQAAWDDNYNF